MLIVTDHAKALAWAEREGIAKTKEVRYFDMDDLRKCYEIRGEIPDGCTLDGRDWRREHAAALKRSISRLSGVGDLPLDDDDSATGVGT